MASLLGAPQPFYYIQRPPLMIPFSAADKNYNLINFRGVPQNPTFRVEELESLVSSFEARAGDIFICTYPKCGTTWMQQICHLLVHNGEQGDTTMYATAPWLECLCAAPILHEREANNYTMEQLAAMPRDRPRFFKSHANFQFLPRGSKAGATGSEGVKVIVVSRNPKDTCVSMWHHAREKPEFNLAGGAPRPGSDDPPAPTPVCDDFEEFVQLFLAGKAECGSWFDHTLEWYAASLSDPNILFLKYEDMIADPAEAISKVAAFIGCGNSSEVIAKAVEASSMKNMRQTSGIYAGNIRKGGVGNWRKKIIENSLINAAFDGEYMKQMKGSGLQFDFGDGLIM